MEIFNDFETNFLTNFSFECGFRKEFGVSKIMLFWKNIRIFVIFLVRYFTFVSNFEFLIKYVVVDLNWLDNFISDFVHTSLTKL